ARPRAARRFLAGPAQCRARGARACGPARSGRFLPARVLAYHTGLAARRLARGVRLFGLPVELRSKRENGDSRTAKATRHAADSRKEPGCKQFDVLVDPKDRTKVLLYEVYLDEKAFDAHQQTAHFKQYAAEAVPLLASRERHVWKRVAP